MASSEGSSIKRDASDTDSPAKRIKTDGKIVDLKQVIFGS